MFNKLIRYYNQNRKKVWTILIIIVLAFCLIKILNYYAKLQNEKGNSGQDSSGNTTAIYQPSQSVVTGDKVPDSLFKEQNNVMDNFINYCNSGKIQEAYNLLSDDCKNVLFPSIEDFKNNYYNMMFSSKKSYYIENWSNDTYRINLTGDILATGKVTDLVTQDYFTVINNNGEYKLNISGFMKKEAINKERTVNGLTIQVVDRQTYMNYEVYTIFIRNNTGNQIILDTLESNDNIYLLDSNGVRHTFFHNEVVDNLMTISNGQSSNITLKFDNPYVTGRRIKSLTFSNIGKISIKNSSFYGSVEYKDIMSVIIDL